jgi:hypothetical protein
LALLSHLLHFQDLLHITPQHASTKTSAWLIGWKVPRHRSHPKCMHRCQHVGQPSLLSSVQLCLLAPLAIHKSMTWCFCCMPAGPLLLLVHAYSCPALAAACPPAAAAGLLTSCAAAFSVNSPRPAAVHSPCWCRYMPAHTQPLFERPVECWLPPMYCPRCCSEAATDTAADCCSHILLLRSTRKLPA